MWQIFLLGWALICILDQICELANALAKLMLLYTRKNLTNVKGAHIMLMS